MVGGQVSWPHSNLQGASQFRDITRLCALVIRTTSTQPCGNSSSDRLPASRPGASANHSNAHRRCASRESGFPCPPPRVLVNPGPSRTRENHQRTPFRETLGRAGPPATVAGTPLARRGSLTRAGFLDLARLGPPTLFAGRSAHWPAQSHLPQLDHVPRAGDTVGFGGLHHQNHGPGLTVTTLIHR